MKTSTKKIAIAAVAVMAIAALCCGSMAWNWYSDNRKSNFSGNADLYLRPGATLEDVRSQIPDSVVINPRSLDRVLSKNLGQIKPGHYVVERNKPSIYVTRMLNGGWQTPVKLVLSGSMRNKGAIARKISRQMMLDSLTVVQALSDEKLLSGYGFTPSDVFSLIIPATYEVYWTDSMKVVLDKQKAAYDAFWTSENIAKAKAQGLTQKEASVLASIVKGESNYEPEYPSIAGVYLNRLHQGIKLQADPTVAYCFDYSLKRVLFRHLEVDSPYNTYMHEGLPPGPICVPDKACLNAVLNPDKHGYIYFCASPDMNGTHKFAGTLSEHNRNAQAFQRALDARR